MSTLSDLSVPDEPPMSPGSSVSTRLQDEYDELLKFAVVVPKYDPSSMQHTLTDARDSFFQKNGTGSHGNRTPTKETLISVSRERDERSDYSDTNPLVVRISQEEEQPIRLPDFGGHSPIRKEEEERRPHDPIPSHYLESPLEKETKGGEYERVYTATVDPDVAKMENLMDQWCLDLKRNVLAEFSQSKIRIVEIGRQQLVKEQEKHASEKTHLLGEINSLKELLNTYEKSIERKDQVISNLTNALTKQKDKNEMMKKFCDWKIKHNDLKREAFSSNLARRHHQRQLARRVWDAWHSVIENKWRQRVERACQSKAQEVCVQLTNDYESRLASANEALEAARQEVAQLHSERDRYEEMMKKAFMRGVCALNLEAMTMFQNGEDPQKENIPNGRMTDDIMENMKDSMPEKDFNGAKTLPAESLGPAPRVVTSQGSRSSSTTTQSKSLTSKQVAPSKGKVLSAKISAKVDSGRSAPGLGGPVVAPPMSSVIVERHQPVTKQTVGHAVAGKYLRPSSSSAGSQSGITHKRIAGQGPLTVNPNIQTVKLVE